MQSNPTITNVTCEAQKCESPPPAYAIAAQLPTAPPPPPPDASNSAATHFPANQFTRTISVGPKPVLINCLQCGARIRTKIRYRSTAKTHIICLMLSCTLCCCCLPYCLKSCRNADHYCPVCGAYVGTCES